MRGPESATGKLDELLFILAVAKVKSWSLGGSKRLRGRGRECVVVGPLEVVYCRTDNDQFFSSTAQRFEGESLNQQLKAR